MGSTPWAKAAPAIVWMAWVLMLLLGLRFVAQYGIDMPIYDEWANVPRLLGEEPVTAQWLWAAHNEHRLPLPRLVYIAAIRATGNDFRAGMVLNVLLMGGSALLLLLAAKDLRGRTHVTDLWIPLALMGLGHFENLLNSFQLQMTLSTFLACLAIRRIAQTRQIGDIWAGISVWICSVLLLLCGGNGAIMAVALTGYLLLRGAMNWREHRRTPGMALAAMGILTGLLFVLVLHGLGTSAAAAAGLTTFASVTRGTLEYLSTAAGPTGALHYMITALAVAALSVWAAVSLYRNWWAQPERRPLYEGLMACLAGLLLMGVAIGWARGPMGEGWGSAPRYVTLSVPILGVIYLVACGIPGRIGRIVPWLILALTVGMHARNTQAGISFAQRKHGQYQRFIDEIGKGFTIDALASRHSSLIYIFDTRIVPNQIRQMLAYHIGPFKHLAIVPPEQPPECYRQYIPLKPIEAHDMELRDGAWVETGSSPYLVFALGGRFEVAAILATFQVDTPDRNYADIIFRWADSIHEQFSDETRLLGQRANPSQGMHTRAFWVYGTADYIRMDVHARRGQVRLKDLVALIRTDPERSSLLQQLAAHVIQADHQPAMQPGPDGALVLLAHPRSSMSLPIPKGTRHLRLGFGIFPEAWRAGRPGVEFRISAQRASGLVTLWSRRLQPATAEGDRGTQHADVDIPDAADDSLVFSLVPAPTSDWGWAYWSQIEAR